MMHVLKFNLFIFNFKISKIKVNSTLRGFFSFKTNWEALSLASQCAPYLYPEKKNKKTLTLENQISEVVLTFILSIIIGSLVGVTSQI